MARPTLNDSAKYKLLIRKLQLPRPYVRGLLSTLWEVGYASGNPVVGDPDQVEAAAEWPGDPGVLFAALRDCRFLDEAEPGVWEIHDFWDHAPEYVWKRFQREEGRKRQYAPRSRQRTARFRAKADLGGPNPTKSDDKRLMPPLSDLGTPPSPSPSPTPRKKKKPPLPPQGGEGLFHPEENIPEGLKTPEFLAAWGRWHRYRVEIRHPLKPTTVEAQLKLLASWGAAAAVASIERSIANSWRGLFPPEGLPAPAQHQAAAKDELRRQSEERSKTARAELARLPKPEDKS